MVQRERTSLATSGEATRDRTGDCTEKLAQSQVGAHGEDMMPVLPTPSKLPLICGMVCEGS